MLTTLYRPNTFHLFIILADSAVFLFFVFVFCKLYIYTYIFFFFSAQFELFYFISPMNFYFITSWFHIVFGSFWAFSYLGHSSVFGLHKKEVIGPYSWKWNNFTPGISLTSRSWFVLLLFCKQSVLATTLNILRKIY